jgi:homoserine dehydrogenase
VQLSRVNIGLCGVGTVGTGVIEVLARNQDVIDARACAELRLQHVGARRPVPGLEGSGVRISQDLTAVADDPQVDIFVELIGGTELAKVLCLRAIANGKHVVTANKALIAEHGNELFAAARSAGVAVRFEAAVAGGVPIIKTLREGLAGNRIAWLAGIINGTCNFILTEMRQRQRPFHEVLSEAQALGYAEADPRFDVEGIDAAHKLSILAAIAFGMPLEYSRVHVEGIARVTVQDLAYAAELGYTIKHLGIARRVGEAVELRVHPTLVPCKTPLASVDGVMNAVLVHGDAVGQTLYYGAGAGSLPTASAVIADLVDLARDIAIGQQSRVPSLAFADSRVNDYPVLPIEDVQGCHYLRIEAEDKPGVLSEIASLLSQVGISIEALIQKAPAAGASKVPVIILTNQAREIDVQKAVAAMEALPTISHPVVRLRVETFTP